MNPKLYGKRAKMLWIDEWKNTCDDRTISERDCCLIFTLKLCLRVRQNEIIRPIPSKITILHSLAKRTMNANPLPVCVFSPISFVLVHSLSIFLSFILSVKYQNNKQTISKLYAAFCSKEIR